MKVLFISERILLIILVAFVAVTSILGGVFMMISPGGRLMNLDPQLLNGTPFHDYFFPGFILSVIVGTSGMLALILLLQRDGYRYLAALLCGLVISGWIVIQVSMIEQIMALHFVYLTTGVIIVFLSLRLRNESRTVNQNLV